MELEFTIPKKRPFKNVFRFKITLLHTKPPVWRRILVPESYTFYDLHVAIQNSMGWTDSHLHHFEKRDVKGKPWEHSVLIDCPYGAEEYEQEENTLYVTETYITQFFKKVGDKIIYTYDFGDNWEHEVLLEKILPREANIKYPVCLDGKLSCPPEDCGSIPGFYDCIKTFKDHKDKERLEWMGDWEPEYFKPGDIIFEDPRERFLESWG